MVFLTKKMIQEELNSIKLAPVRKATQGVYSCRIRTAGQQNDKLYVQTPESIMIDGITNIGSDNTRTQLQYNDPNFTDMIELITNCVLEQIPTNVLRLIYNNEQMSMKHRTTLLQPLIQKNNQNDSNIIDVHCSINNSTLSPTFIVYDHNGQQIDIDDLTMEQSSGKIISILHFKEVLFTTTTIKIVVFIEQIMCLSQPVQSGMLFHTQKPVDNIMENEQTLSQTPTPTHDDTDEQTLSQTPTPTHDDTDEQTLSQTPTPTHDDTDETSENVILDMTDILDNSGDLVMDKTHDTSGVVIVDISGISDEDPLMLRDRKKVYREMFERFLRDAIDYQEKAVQSYLKAKKIKDDIFENDNDLDSLLSDIDFDDFMNYSDDENNDTDSDDDSETDSDDDSETDSDDDSETDN